MNVIKLELKRLRLSTIIWTVVLIGFFLIALTEYEAFEVSGDAVNVWLYVWLTNHYYPSLNPSLG